MERVLLIDTCRNPLHCLEFVDPIKDAIKKSGADYFVEKYSKLNYSSVKTHSHIIISGNALCDNDFVFYLDSFSFLKNVNTPVLGICAGMQILARIFGAEIVDAPEIGVQNIFFKKNFLGLKGDVSVYSLHNSSVKFLRDFEVFAESEKSIQAIKHKCREVYGAMFHPEVRHGEVIRNFLKIKSLSNEKH